MQASLFHFGGMINYAKFHLQISNCVDSNYFPAQFIEIVSHYGGLAVTLVCCNGLRAWWSAQSRKAALLSSLVARRWVGLRALWQFLLGDLSVDGMVAAWCFGCCRTRQCLPVGSILLRCSVLFTVGFLFFLCFFVFFVFCLFLFFFGGGGVFICVFWGMVRRWVGVLRAGRASVCLGPRPGWGGVGAT